MRIENKPTIFFTEQEYTTFNKACMMLDDLVNGDSRTAFETIMDNLDLDYLYGMFADVVNYVEAHRE